jgi:hypothetical protein
MASELIELSEGVEPSPWLLDTEVLVTPFSLDRYYLKRREKKEEVHRGEEKTEQSRATISLVRYE